MTTTGPTETKPIAPDPAIAPDPRPSVRVVLGTLLVGRPLTGAEVRERSGLPRRTVYQALRILREQGLVRQRSSLQDTRQSYFWLVGQPPAADESGLGIVAEDPSGPLFSGP
ncbi:MAG: Sugar-specific transcriptional regulator TrmB [Thermoplasmata archaeon]|jgi:hypothetical protein|nr:Sugar-specific transcriptional regulator TrmB [Thermoplasmata archaeon]